MTQKILLLSLLLGKGLFSQSNSCECLVKLYDNDLKVHFFGQSNSFDIPKEYGPMRPKAGQPFEYNKVIKDSAAFWFIESQSRDSNSKHSVIQMKKLGSTFSVEIIFNNRDSIPLFSEPDKNSKIVRYIRPNEQKYSKNNEYWFAGCKNGYVKIVSFEQGKFGGWVTSDSYYHN